ncbi:uncharacterized protein LOC119609672 [Lucilia sericata]|uniref:uncharacterized protein LOC119609672 n=1 Tax=Lucilia sericata TaxID=13632 RepID=UPI0018A87916|nr:uncharacterized protein LOC119609672 [Lucilia sericata]
MKNKKFILEFIEVYRSLPALWQIKSKEYYNKKEKDLQYKILLKKYRELEPKAEKKDVAMKINSLRTAYRKELKRIEKLEELGTSDNGQTESNLFFFEALDFIRESLKPNASQTIAGDGDENEVENNAKRKKRKKPDPAEELMILAAKRLSQPPDECDKIIESWAVKFKNMSPTQRLYADKFINEILFEGQLGMLHRNSMMLNVLDNCEEKHII